LSHDGLEQHGEQSLHGGLEQHGEQLSHDGLEQHGERSWYDSSFGGEQQRLFWLPYFSV
jgi:hypothetical protein